MNIKQLVKSYFSHQAKQKSSLLSIIFKKLNEIFNCLFLVKNKLLKIKMGEKKMGTFCLAHELELKSHRAGHPTFFFFLSNAHLGLRVLYLFVTHLKSFLF